MYRVFIRIISGGNGGLGWAREKGRNFKFHFGALFQGEINWSKNKSNVEAYKINVQDERVEGVHFIYYYFFIAWGGGV